MSSGKTGVYSFGTSHTSKRISAQIGRGPMHEFLHFAHVMVVTHIYYRNSACREPVHLLHHFARPYSAQTDCWSSAGTLIP